MKWISVEIDMPETNPDSDYSTSKLCLVICAGTCEIALWQHGDEDGGWNNWYSPAYEDSIENVTHWMPLPEPPKESE